ncbi:MAG: polysaccharide export protein [Planctomycetota bacterium]|nr:MAG: polysaccharide export protein [Planctomycetota bacterium]
MLPRLAPALLLLLAGCTTLAPPPEESAPPPFEFRLGPGDRISVSVWGEKDLHRELVLGPDGAAAFPLIGSVQLAGLTPDEARVELAKRLRSSYVDPVVSVSLLESRSHVIHVAGEVALPGSVPFVRGATVLGVLGAAGGFLPATAALDQVRVIRARLNDPHAFQVDVEAILAGQAWDMWLLPGDVVYVPPRTLTRWNRWWRQAWPWSDPVDRPPARAR